MIANAASDLRAATEGKNFSDGSRRPTGFVLPVASEQRGGGSMLGRVRGPALAWPDAPALSFPVAVWSL
ncbi:MAG: hypothetical protein CYG60_15810 [Actinobacteria bacterium]|nr:MAG: hypothetical protein CYG60_15810 [Actinomycetota bacterium]